MGTWMKSLTVSKLTEKYKFQESSQAPAALLPVSIK
jgi:hypothetical protein